MDYRTEQLQKWLKTQLGERFSFEPVTGDASFRRYFRVQNQQSSYIAMDAPPDKENMLPFIAIAQSLQNHQIRAPKLFAQDLNQGFLLLEDFGNTLLFSELGSPDIEKRYIEAIDLLQTMQSCKTIETYDLKPLAKNFMLAEINLFSQWFLAFIDYMPTAAQQNMLIKTFTQLVERCILQKSVFVHRDYHCRNLMIHQNQLAVLDFQDAMLGPISYDLISLLKDAYISWPRAFQLKGFRYFCQLADIKDTENFVRQCDEMSLQRHLKVLGIFARLHLRDQKSQYLDDIPRVLTYMQESLKALDCFPEFQEFMQTQLIPAFFNKLNLKAEAL